MLFKVHWKLVRSHSIVLQTVTVDLVKINFCVILLQLLPAPAPVRTNKSGIAEFGHFTVQGTAKFLISLIILFSFWFHDICIYTFHIFTLLVIFCLSFNFNDFLFIH